ncbi:MAG TPA: hypothetical protein VFY29_00780, partial [Terriglobia bacterium]|nr:hypothetical protein [Terriglobia bacterium]
SSQSRLSRLSGTFFIKNRVPRPPIHAGPKIPPGHDCGHCLTVSPVQPMKTVQHREFEAQRPCAEWSSHGTMSSVQGNVWSDGGNGWRRQRIASSVQGNV